MKPEPLLEIRGLRIEAGGVPLLHGLDLTVHRGEVLGLIGESGAGKSTAGLAAMGVIKPGCRLTGGSIRFDGIDLATAPERVRRDLRGTRIAYVAQSAAAAFNPAHRLLDQTIESMMGRRGAQRSRMIAQAEALYARLHLPYPQQFGRRFPHQVSGGQLQRAMTAMGMIALPDLIIFDEPTTALDVTTQVGVLAAIREAVEESGVAAIYISHDLPLVAQMAHRIMVLRHGALVEEAPTRRILAAPQMEYTRSLFALHRGDRASRPAADTLLAVQSVDVRFGPLRAVDGVSLTVPRGRTVAVVGESGSGKSTLARVVAGLRPPSAGSIRFDGAVLSPGLRQRSPATRRRIQLVYQSADTALNPRHTVRTLLGRPLRLYQGLRGAEQEDALLALLAMVDISPALLEHRPSELSGGQKQRIAIARALAAQPDLIICDEITSALDKLVQEGILAMLMALQERTGVAYLFITHDLATVRAIADDVVVMHAGRVVEHGPARVVLNAPRSPYTARLLASVPTMDPNWLDQVQHAAEAIG
jgi:peptide/nickel transport system ATP-binding protein